MIVNIQSLSDVSQLSVGGKEEHINTFGTHILEQ